MNQTVCFTYCWKWIVFLWLCGVPSLQAQVWPRGQLDTPYLQVSKKKQLIVQLDVENGGMMTPDRKIAQSLGDVYYNGVNLRVGWQTDRDGEAYHQLYNYPIYGLGVYASTFRKAEIGTPTALYGFVSVPVVPGRFRRWDFNYRISLGLASNSTEFWPIISSSLYPVAAKRYLLTKMILPCKSTLIKNMLMSIIKFENR